MSVFHAVASCGGSVLVLIHSDGKKTSYYFGTKTPDYKDLDILEASVEALEKTLKGNFPGTKIQSVRAGEEINGLMESVFTNKKFKKQEKQVCTISGIAGLRAKEESQEKLFIQGLEKLVDSMQGEEYSLLLIADPVIPEQVNIVKNRYEDLYSQIVHLATSDLSYGENENESVSDSVIKGFSEAINESVTDSLTHTKGRFNSHTRTYSKSSNISFGRSISAGIPGIIGATDSINIGRAKGISDGYTFGESESEAKGTAVAKGTTKAESEQKGTTDSFSKGKNWNLQMKLENKSIKNLLEKIDLQLKRIDASKDIGMWNCSVYCLSNVKSTCKIAASAYQSLLRGENSSIETGVITEWSKENAVAILPYLEKMHHPILKMTDSMEITPTSLISTSELTIHAGIPQTSVSGLPVMEMA